MHFQQKISLTALFFFFLISFGCQNSNNKAADKALEAIPNNATMVTAFDLPSLMEKSNFEVIKQMEFYQFLKERAQEESDMLATVFSNPENAGIDLNKNAYLSIELNPDNPEEIYTGLIFNLANVEDFENFANSFRNARLSKRNNYQVSDLNEATLLAWNEKVGIIALGEGILEATAAVDAFFMPDSETSLANNENLNQLLAQKHDVTTWLTSNALAQNKSAKLVLSMAKIDPEAIHDNYIHAYMDFEQGKVDAKVNYLFQDALIEDIHLLLKDQVPTDFSPYIPGNNLNAYISAGLSFEGLEQALDKRPQVKTFANFFLRKYGISIQKLNTILDGDIVFATYTGNVNNRQEGLFAIKLKQQAAFEQLLAQAEENELVTKTGNGRYLIAPSVYKIITSIIPMEIGDVFDNQLMIVDGIAFLSSNIELLDKIESGDLKNSTQQVPTNINAMVKQNPIALFLDFNSLKRTGVPGANSLDILEFSSNKLEANLNLELKDKSVNSLQAIFEAVNKEYLTNKEKRQPVSQEKS